MAHDARPARHDLTLPAPPEAMDVFELLRRLEGGGLAFGRSGGPGREPARLGQGARLAAATRDVARLVPGEGDAPTRVEIEVLGLLGPEGPMPLHLTRRIVDRLSQRWFEAGGDRATADTAALDLCNLLQHRHLALYWRAWADAQGAVHLDRPGAGRLGATLAALAGIGLPGQRTPPEARDTDPVALSHAPRLAWQLRGPERIARPLADLLGAPVRVAEFMASWLAIPRPLQTRLGMAHAALGRGATAGDRLPSRTARAELRVGPVGLGLFLRLADDRGLRARLRHLLLHLAGRDLAWDLRPVLAAAEVPEPRLGRVALGRSAWLPARGLPRDRDDLRLSDVAGPLSGGAPA